MSELLLRLQQADRLCENVDSVLNVINTTDTDTAIRICERCCFLVYQDTSFGIVKEVDNDTIKLLKFILSFIMDYTNLFVNKNNYSEWFAGETEDTSGGCYTVERIIYSMIIAKSTIGECFLDYLERIDRSNHYISSIDFAQRLLNNDERCLTLIVALLSKFDSIETSSTFNPVNVSLSVFYLIDFDTQLIIDWLTSEISSNSFILRILKSCCDKKKCLYWKEAAKNFKFMKIPSMKTWKTVSDVSKIPPRVVLKIQELHADDEPTLVEYKLYGQAQRRVLIDDTIHHQEKLREIDIWMEFCSMIHDLGLKLDRLLKAELISPKIDVLRRWCFKFNEMTNNE